MVWKMRCILGMVDSISHAHEKIGSRGFLSSAGPGVNDCMLITPFEMAIFAGALSLRLKE